MAPEAYRAVHPEARLTAEERAVLSRWLEGYREKVRVLQAPNPAMFELPAKAYAGQDRLPPGSWRASNLVRARPLVLDGAVLQLVGASRLEVLGRGVVILRDQAVLTNSDAGVCTVDGKRGFRLSLPDLSERKLSFCRDDGELGETNERSFHVFYGHGQFLILETELEVGRSARTPAEALRAVEEMLAQDPTTNLAKWRRRFHQAWEREFHRMTGAPAGAVLEYHPGERGPR
jgi:hypothetical protein